MATGPHGTVWKALSTGKSTAVASTVKVSVRGESSPMFSALHIPPIDLLPVATL